MKKVGNFSLLAFFFCRFRTATIFAVLRRFHRFHCRFPFIPCIIERMYFFD